MGFGLRKIHSEVQLATVGIEGLGTLSEMVSCLDYHSFYQRKLDGGQEMLLPSEEVSGGSKQPCAGELSLIICHFVLRPVIGNVSCCLRYMFLSVLHDVHLAQQIICAIVRLLPALVNQGA